MKNYTITITRQFGSLGRPIAQEIAQMLGIEYYDRDIVEKTSKELSLPFSILDQHDENLTKSSFFNMLFPLGTEDISRQDQVFETQRRIILDFAEKSPCIIVGRCSDYILRNHTDCLSIYIYAPLEARYRNCVDILKMEPARAKKND